MRKIKEFLCMVLATYVAIAIFEILVFPAVLVLKIIIKIVGTDKDDFL